MDVMYPLLVVGTAERHILIIDLNQPTTIHRVRAIEKYLSAYLKILTFNFLTANAFSSEMANAVYIMLPRRKWFCGR